LLRRQRSSSQQPNAHFWTELLIANADLDRLAAKIPETARLALTEWRNMMGYPATKAPNRAVPAPASIPLIEAVHELHVICNVDLRSAIIKMVDLLSTGQLPPADALVDGAPAKIDPRWWWAGAVEYPNSSAAFNLLVDGEPRPTRATEVSLDRSAWERRKSQIAPPKQQSGELFPNRDDPAWDNPMRLIDAIRFWSPAFALCLYQLKWAAPDDIRAIAQRLERYDHPTRVRARRDRAKRQHDRYLNPGSVRESLGVGRDQATDQDFPEPLRDAWKRLLEEWDHWDDAERLVHAFELGGRLIIEKTKRGQPYILKYAPPASSGDLGDDYQRVGEARHNELLQCHFDIPNSMIKDPGSNWLSVRIYRDIEEEAKRMGKARSERKTRYTVEAATPEEPFVNSRLRAAVQSALQTFGTPGRTVQWKPFCDRIRAECQVTAQTRGYGDRSIQRVVKATSPKTDK
jgi:hypothetical protein